MLTKAAETSLGIIPHWTGCMLVCAMYLLLLTPTARVSVLADSGDLEKSDSTTRTRGMNRGVSSISNGGETTHVTTDSDHVSRVFPLPGNHKRTRISHVNERQTRVNERKTPSRPFDLGTSPGPGDFVDSHTTSGNRDVKNGGRKSHTARSTGNINNDYTHSGMDEGHTVQSYGRTMHPNDKTTSRQTLPDEITFNPSGSIISHTTIQVDPASHSSVNMPQTTIAQAAQIGTEWDVDSEVTTEHGNQEEMTTGTQSDIDMELLTTLTNLVEHTPTDVMTLVKALQTQFKESKTSQVRTRSVLYEIQEKQQAQEADLAVLKNHISEIRSQQEEDHASLEELRTLVSDNNWALANLKSSHNQFRVDVRTLKQFQEKQNETIEEFDDLVDRTDQLHETYRMSIGQLQRDIHQIKTVVTRDRQVLNQIKQVLGSASEYQINSTQAKNTSFPNRINTVLGPDGTESSGDAQSSREDTLASRLEETDNTVGHKLVHIIEHGNKMKEEMNGLQGKFVQYDADFAKMYAMFYNLSLQVSSLDNRLLAHQQHRFESDMGELQRSLANFTQQIFNLEQWHMNSRGFVNTSSRNQHDINHMNIILENHTNRIKTMEQMLLEQRTTGELNHDLLAMHLAQINSTIQEYERKFSHHNHRASSTFEGVDDKLDQLTSQLHRHDNRLAQVEVRVLNGTLQQCEKGSKDLIQDAKLSSFSMDLDRAGRMANENTGKISRLDRGVSRLFQDLQNQGKTVSEVMDQVSKLLHILSDVSDLKHEVNNFVQQLPPDCKIPLATHKNISGTYLIKPEESYSSARTYCLVDEGAAWTLIQQRNNGSESFSRTWLEYKQGFGEPEQEFWIGNDNLHYLTTQNDYLLHIDMWDVNGNYWYADYNFFKVDEESTNYRLHIDGYSGNATDALKYSNFMPFSTIDRDNDVSSTHCAKFYTSGWWYKHCHYSNLNGRYTVGIVWFSHITDEWLQMRKTVMKIRPLNETVTFF